jgi:hypothetical protein
MLWDGHEFEQECRVAHTAPLDLGSLSTVAQFDIIRCLTSRLNISCRTLSSYLQDERQRKKQDKKDNPHHESLHYIFYNHLLCSVSHRARCIRSKFCTCWACAMSSHMPSPSLKSSTHSPYDLLAIRSNSSPGTTGL